MAVCQVKRYVNNISIFDIIVNKLTYYKEFFLGFWLNKDKNLKVYLYYTILSFYFTIDLKVKSGKKLLLNIKKVIYREPVF